MYALRVKKENENYSSVITDGTLNQILEYISLKSDEISKVEIAKDGKLFFVFSMDSKSRMFLSFLSSVNSDEKTETIKTKRKRVKKPSKKV